MERSSKTVTPHEVGLAVARRSLNEVYGQEPLMVRMGGTLPVSELLKRLLGIDTVNNTLTLNGKATSG